MKILKYFGSILKQLDLGVLAIVINETHVIILPSN
jgi:hypothetical protein